MNEVHVSSAARWRRLSRLVRKETAGVLRDRRTLTTLLLMPFLLYPLLAIGFRQFLLSQQADRTARVYRIAFRNEEERSSIARYLLGGEALLKREAEAAPEQTPNPTLQSSVTNDLENALREGMYDLGMAPRREGGFRFDKGEELGEDWELLYRADSAFGQDAFRYMERLIAASNQFYLANRLNYFRVRQNNLPVTLKGIALKDPGAKKPETLAILVPLVLILMTITGGVYPAIDSTAGERERGTLEILMAAPISKFSLLFSKYVAVLSVALLTAVVNLVAMTITMLASGIGPTLFGGGLTVWTLLSIFGLLLLFAAFFSAVLLALTSFARSFKEAQAYLIPLMLAALAPGMLSLAPSVKLHGFWIITPLANIVLLARDALQGQVQPLAAAAVVVSTLLYALAALALAARIFGAEAVLYTDQGTWSDLFRRPANARSSSTPAGAFLCLAVLFPAYFMTTGAAQLLPESPVVRMAFMSAASILLFAGLPMFAAYLGRIRVQTGFRLSRPPLAALAATFLLGLSLWPFVHELTLGVTAAGVSTLPAEYIEQMKKVLVEWRQSSPLLPVLTLGVIPPLVEELFFRGYLLGALLTLGRPRWAIVASAVLFGLFHLLVLDSLAVERLLPSILLGLLLGWMAWRTGSIWAGVVMHVTHNSLLVLLGYYEPQLSELGWNTEPGAHLPYSWLGMAAAVAAAGGVVLWLSTRSPNFSRDKASVDDQAKHDANCQNG
jgi:sodium transport system permease protein